MPGIQINKLTNANLYINGGSYLGRAEEVTLPAVKGKFSDHKGLGMIMDVEFPNGFEKMTGKIKWSSLYPDIVAQIGSPFAPVQMQVRAYMSSYDASGALVETAVVVFLVARFKDSLSSTVLKMNDPSEQESEFSATYYRMEIDGTPLVEIDAISQLFFLAGNDQLANYRNILGI